MTKQQALNQLDSADLSAFSSDEKTMLRLIVETYSNRKLEDAGGVAYAVGAMKCMHVNSSDRTWLMEQFMQHIVTPKGFYRIAAFRPQQLQAQELGLVINFPYPVTKYTK